MIKVISEMLSYPFLVRAIIVGVLVSLCASLLGVSLVLKRYSMIGDGLSHVGFGALAIATALNLAPLGVSIPVVIAAAFLLLRISENSKIKGDAAIALISSGALATGVMTVSLTTGMNTDVCNYMFGSILSLSVADARLSIILSIAVIIIFTVFYNRIFAITFDESFSKATGIKTGGYNAVTAVLTAVTVVLGMRMMGALLISSLIIFPALTAMRIFKTYKSVIICSAALSVISFLTGMTVSYIMETPSGASVVCVNIVFFILFWLMGKLRSMRIPNIRKMAGMLTIVILFSSMTAACASKKPIPVRDKSATLPAETTSTEITNEPGPTEAVNEPGPTEAVNEPEPTETVNEPEPTEAANEPEPTETVNEPEPVDDETVVITEKMYVAYINDIYTNTDLYIGRKIQLEGMFTWEYYDVTDRNYYYVYRVGPGCCGNDGGMCGFEFTSSDEMPEENAWIEVTGILETYEEGGDIYLTLTDCEIEVKTIRGSEFVS